MYIFYLTALSRCLKAIPGEHESQSHFLVGANTNTNAFIVKATYDIDSKKLITSDLVNFVEILKEKEEEKIINEVMGIYTSTDYNESTGVCDRFFTQVFNQTDNQYQLKMFNKNKENSDASKFEYSEIKACDNENIFDIKIGNDDNLYQITSDRICKVDLNKPNDKEELIILSNNRNKQLKICSDNSKIDHNQLAVGVGQDLFLVDLNSNSNKVINKVLNAHYNGILACEFDPFKSYILATTGMDYSVKFWDIRNLSTPIGGVYNNTHWVWDMKYNRKFSRVMITCSSSSVVRGVVFDKERDVEDMNNEDHEMNDIPHLQTYSAIDYVEFDDSVYSLDWSINDPWTFAAVSYNSYLYINSIPEEIKYKIMLDN